MNSKKLGMFAAAALTVAAAAQANAADKKAVKAAEESVCASSCGNNCKGKTFDDAKDPAACDAKKGKWMTKTAFEKSKKAEGTTPAATPKADSHQH